MTNDELNDALKSLSLKELVALPAVADLLSDVRSFHVNAIPEEYRSDSDASNWDVKVVWRGDNQWAVDHHGDQLNHKGKWNYESLPSSRTEKFIATHRFDLVTALELAEEAAKHITINSLTVDGFVKWSQARKIADSESSEGLDPEQRSRRFYDILQELEPGAKLQNRIDLALKHLDSSK